MRVAALQSWIRRVGLLPGLVLALAVGGTLIISEYAQYFERQRINQAFGDLARRNAARVLQRVDAYERSLIDLRGLFIGSENVTESEFQRYLAGTEVSRRYPALFRIGYAVLVTPANQERILSRLRSMGAVGFEMPGESPYFPILYGYPTTTGLLGMNLNSGAVRWEALERARDHNRPQLTRLIRLRFDDYKKPGFLLYVPLYGDQVAPPTVERRRQFLSGYVYAAFRVEDLIQSTIGPDLDRLMDLALFDAQTTDPEYLAYDSGGAFQRFASKNHETYTNVQTLDVSGLALTFAFIARPEFIAAQRSQLPGAVLSIALLASALATWLSVAISKRLLAERAVRYLAFHDELTGMPNRTKLRSDLSARIKHGQETGEPFALLIVELDRFREISYTLGHVIGDEVLKRVSSRLSHVAQGHATVARVSNLQFGMLLPNADAATALAAHILHALEEPLTASEINCQLGAHAGIALFPQDGTETDELLRHADIAINDAHNAGLEFALYNPSQDPYKPQRLALVGAFRNAIKEEELRLYCQPKVDLRSGTVTSAEALVRWHHPTYGLISPDEFIPLIEPTELIQLLTQRMLESALRQCNIWRQNNLIMPLAINLSARNLLDPALPDIIDRLMRQWGADASWLDVEITESSVMANPALSLRVLNKLHAMGLKLFVDDFGTGYSSLSYLMKLPINVIKIDHYFTMNMLEDPDAAMIVEAVIELAHKLGLGVVAEGTASKEIWDALQRLDCDEAQGHYISPPMPADDFTVWLKRSSWHYVTCS